MNKNIRNKIGLIASDVKFFFLSGISKVINLFPHKENIIIFESNSDFCDNPKALFDYMINVGLNNKYEMVWIVNNINNVKQYINIYDNVHFIEKTRPKLNKKFLVLIYYYSIARYAFYSHSFIGMPNNKQQIRFFMTHAAVPLKNTKNKFWNYRRNSYILSTSEFAAFYRCLTFGGGLERAQFLGFPRNDKLFENGNSVKKKLRLETFNKVIIWMPTFKHHQADGRNDFQNDSDKDISLLTSENIFTINEKLKENNIGLVIKFHPAQNMKYVSNINLTNILTVSNAELLANGIELYTLVGACDALITDFSSIYFDYLLVDRPIAFELGDKTNYESGVGFLVDKPLDYMPGKKIYKINDILNFIDDIVTGNDEFQNARHELTKKVHKYVDDKSSQRIVEFLGLLNC